MSVSRAFPILVLGLALLTPGLAAAQAKTDPAPRLWLNPLDADRDGVVTDLERETRAAFPAEIIAVSTPPIERRSLFKPDAPRLAPDGLSLERRVEPASEFEKAQAYQFEKAWPKKH